MRKHLAQTQKKSSQERLILVSNLLSLPSPHLNHNINNDINNKNINNEIYKNNNKNEEKNQNKKNEMKEKIEKGRYKITNKIIGEGANGDVFLAFDPITNQEIALKIVTFHDLPQKKLFEKEVNFSFQMSGQDNVLNYISSHSFLISTKKNEEKNKNNINNNNNQSLNEFYYSIDEIKELIEIGMIEIDLNDDENSFFDQKEGEKEEMEYGVIAMEKMTIDLIDYRINNQLTNDQVRKLFYSICKSIEQCHANHVFHLDLKPDNILLLFSPDNNNNNNNYNNENQNNNFNNKFNKNNEENNFRYSDIKGIKLCDFGFATNEKKINLKDYSRFGTRSYLPPECFPIGDSSSNKIINADKVDIWGLGVTLFVLLTGQFPFIQNKKGEFIKNKVRIIGDDLADDLVHLLLDFNFHRRPNIFTVMKHPYISLSSHPYTSSNDPSPSHFSSYSSFHFNSFLLNYSSDETNNENNINNNVNNDKNNINDDENNLNIDENNIKNVINNVANNSNLKNIENNLKNTMNENEKKKNKCEENNCKKLKLFAKIKRQMKKFI